MARIKARKDKKTGVLMIGHGEPEVFDEEVWSEGLHEMFEEFRQTGLEVPPDDAFPMMLMEIKDKYEAMGGRSRHAEACRKQCELVSQHLSDYDVRIGFNEFIGPTFTDVALEMVKEGIKKILFVPMLQTDSTHTAEVRNKIEALDLDKQGIKWVMSKPLFYRAEPTQLVIERIAEAAGNTPLEYVGVVLASHGEPDEWTRLCLENTRCKEQETAFCACVKKGLIERGFVWDHIVQGFNEFTHPELPEAVEKLADKNVKKVIVMPSFGSTDGMHVNYDIPTKAKSALVDPDIEVVCLGGWNEDPLLIKAYVELAKEALARL
jgi:protoheme ferro-lyase